jgi:uncharacterized iron-regulated protein
MRRDPRTRRPWWLALAALAAACAPRTPSAPAPGPDRSLDLRIIAPDSGTTFTVDALAGVLASVDVVVFGEQHDDPGTHRAQYAVLEALGRRKANLVLSLEMFERDVQPVLDDYLAGRVNEVGFLARSRPWARYRTDYRPVVELARARGWPVVAANVPRPIASAVGRHGLAALDTLPPAERARVASENQCPHDAYRDRFLAQMRSHTPGSGSAQPNDSLPTAVAERFYLAQCVKDETMAESVVEALRRAGAGATVLHLTGAFHSDFGQGTVERIRRRIPEARVAVITGVPVADPAAPPDSGHAQRADYVIFTRRAR